MRDENTAGPGQDIVSALRYEAMRVADLDEVLAIEQASFSTPWSRAAYHRELITNGYATYLIGRLDGHVITYGGMWVILDEAHVTNIAVDPGFRARGAGRRTMAALEERAAQLGASRMTLEVRVSNLAARRLYEALGYHGTGVRRNYYSDTHEDAMVMWKDLGPPPSGGRPSGGGPSGGRPNGGRP